MVTNAIRESYLGELWSVSAARRLQALGALLLMELEPETWQRPALSGTPLRWAETWLSFRNYQAGRMDTVFEAVQTDQMVLLKGVEVWSLCEHHLLPFRCLLDIAYLTQGQVLGISKLARIAQLHAHKLQLQERLVTEIADDLAAKAGAASVAVIGRGQHLCMQMRGIRSNGEMVTSVMRGAFRDQGPTREEFLRLIS